MSASQDAPTTVVNNDDIQIEFVNTNGDTLTHADTTVNSSCGISSTSEEPDVIPLSGTIGRNLVSANGDTVSTSTDTDSVKRSTIAASTNAGVVKVNSIATSTDVDLSEGNSLFTSIDVGTNGNTVETSTTMDTATQNCWTCKGCDTSDLNDNMNDLTLNGVDDNYDVNDDEADETCGEEIDNDEDEFVIVTLPMFEENYHVPILNDRIIQLIEVEAEVEDIINEAHDIENILRKNIYKALLCVAIKYAHHDLLDFVLTSDWLNLESLEYLETVSECLVYAVRLNDYDSAAILLDKDADPNHKIVTSALELEGGYNTLNAMEMSILMDNEEIMYSLYPSYNFEDDLNHRSCVHIAAELGSLACLTYLIHNLKCDVNRPDKIGRTPLMYSACSSLEVTQFLLAEGAEVGVTDMHLGTCLHHAMTLDTITCRTRDSKVLAPNADTIVSMFLKDEDDLAKLDTAGRSPFSCVATICCRILEANPENYNLEETKQTITGCLETLQRNVHIAEGEKSALSALWGEMKDMMLIVRESEFSRDGDQIDIQNVCNALSMFKYIYTWMASECGELFTNTRKGDHQEFSFFKTMCKFHEIFYGNLQSRTDENYFRIIRNHILECISVQICSRQSLPSGTYTFLMFLLKADPDLYLPFASTILGLLLHPLYAPTIRSVLEDARFNDYGDIELSLKCKDDCPDYRDVLKQAGLHHDLPRKLKQQCRSLIFNTMLINRTSMKHVHDLDIPQTLRGYLCFDYKCDDCGAK